MGKGGRAIAGGASENLALSPLEPAHRHAATRHDSWLSLLGSRRRQDAISMLYIKGIEMTHGKLGGITVAVLAEFGVGEGGMESGSYWPSNGGGRQRRRKINDGGSAGSHQPSPRLAACLPWPDGRSVGSLSRGGRQLPFPPRPPLMLGLHWMSRIKRMTGTSQTAGCG